jgi:hypothetical protein
MFLQDDRRLFRTFVPVVHSSVRLLYGTTSKELPYVAGPQNLNLSSTLGAGVQLNHRLTNLLPFKGGAVDVAAALVAYKEKDFFQNFVNVLHDVSGLLNLGQLSASLKVAETAIDGIQNLLGAGEKDIHLMLYQGYGGDTGTGGSSLSSGYMALVRADENRFDKTKLYVKNDRLFFGDSAPAAQPLKGYDYMLLRIESAVERDDYLSFEEFAKLLNNAIREGHTDRTKGDAVIQTSEIIVWDSTDLTATDRFRVATALKDLYMRALGPAHPATPSSPKPPEVSVREFAAAVQGIKPDTFKSTVEKLTQQKTPDVGHFRALLANTALSGPEAARVKRGRVREPTRV